MFDESNLKFLLTISLSNEITKNAHKMNHYTRPCDQLNLIVLEKSSNLIFSSIEKMFSFLFSTRSFSQRIISPCLYRLLLQNTLYMYVQPINLTRVGMKNLPSRYSSISSHLGYIYNFPRTSSEKKLTSSCVFMGRS